MSVNCPPIKYRWTLCYIAVVVTAILVLTLVGVL